MNDIGAKHGIGRVDVVENRYVGMKRAALKRCLFRKKYQKILEQRQEQL